MALVEMKWALAAMVLQLSVAGSALAQDTPRPGDIPKPGPITLGPAGVGKPDIARFLLVRGAQRMTISPDGATIAYIDASTGEPQLWVAPGKGGAARQLTFGAGIDEVYWAPDGSLIYGADGDGDGRMGYTAISLDGTREQVLVAKSDAFTVFGDISADGKLAYGSTARNGRDFDIYVVDAPGAPARRVFEGSFGYYPQQWRPGSSEILIRDERGEDGADVYLLNVQTGALKTLLKPADAAEHNAFAWKPDGSGFYMVSNEGRDMAGVALYDMASGRLSYVETPDAEVQQVSLTKDGRWLGWTVDRGGVTELAFKNTQTGAKVAPPHFPAGQHVIDIAKDAPVAAVQTNGPKSVGEVFVVNLASGALTHAVATTWAGLSPSMMVEPERLTFKARDGVTLNGLYYKPPGVTGAPPLLLNLHGGPSSHAVAGYAPDVQYYLSRGIAVFDFNYRGSTGSGKAYARLNDKRLRPNEINDLEDTANFLSSTGRADRTRLAVGGRSYGGYLTNAVIGAHPELFKAAISMVGVSDWVKALEGASPMLKASDRVEYGDIDNAADRAFFASISPVNNAAKIKTPVLFEHGANDPQDPVTESDRMVAAIRQTGGEVVYLRFADEGHGVVKRANRVYLFRQVAAFLEAKLGTAAP